MHLRRNSRGDVNSALQNAGSASPHGARSACASPCAYGGGADGGGDGGGAGQKKQDPLHFSGNGAFLHLTRNSRGDVNSALQNAGSASPHGARSACASPCAYGGGAEGGGDGGGAGQKKQDPLHFSGNGAFLHLRRNSRGDVNSALQNAGSASPHGARSACASPCAYGGGAEGGGDGGGAGQKKQDPSHFSGNGAFLHLRRNSRGDVNSALQNAGSASPHGARSACASPCAYGGGADGGGDGGGAGQKKQDPLHFSGNGAFLHLRRNSRGDVNSALQNAGSASPHGARSACASPCAYGGGGEGGVGGGGAGQKKQDPLHFSGNGAFLHLRRNSRGDVNSALQNAGSASPHGARSACASPCAYGGGADGGGDGGGAGQKKQDPLHFSGNGAFLHLRRNSRGDVNSALQNAGSASPHGARSACASPCAYGGGADGGGDGGGAGQKKQDPLHFSGNGAFLHLRRNSRGDVNSALQNAGSASPHGARSACASPCAYGGGGEGGVGGGGAGQKKQDPLHFSGNGAFLHLRRNSRGDVNSALQNAGSASPHGARSACASPCAYGGGADGGGDGGGAGQKKQDPSHFSGNGAFLHLRRNSRGDVNSALQNAGSASPHGARSACASPCAYGGGADGGGDGGGAGQKKQDPSHFSGNGAFLHLRRNSRGDVNSALQNAGSASPHGARSACASPCAYGGGADGGGDGGGAGQKKQDPLHFSGNGAFLHLRRNSRGDVNSALQNAGSASPHGARSACASPCAYGGGGEGGVGGGGAGQKKQDPLHFSGNGAFLHLRRNSRGDVNSALQNAGSASPHGARSACASPCAYGGGGEGGVGGGGAGQKKQDPLHFSGNGAFLHLRRNSRGDVNSALQNAGSASPHGARSACASPCAYGGGADGGGDGGGAGQKKQDPSHFSGNGAFLHLRRNSRGDVNSALQNAGSASPHGARSACASPCAYGGGADGGGDGGGAGQKKQDPSHFSGNGAFLHLRRNSRGDVNSALQNAGSASPHGARSACASPCAYGGGGEGGVGGGGAGQKKQDPLHFSGNGAFLHLRRNSRGDVNSALQNAGSASPHGARSACASPCAYGGGADGGGDGGGAGQKKQDPSHFSGNGAFLHLRRNSRGDVNSALQNAGSASPHGARSACASPCAYGGGADGGGDGGGAGQKKQDPLHFSGNGAFLHLRRNSRGDVNSALQNAGSASPHGARSACASPCAYGGGGEGGVGGGGAGQKKQDPLHFSGNGAFLHLRRNSRGDVNSALQNAGSASPHGARSACASPCAYGGGADGGGDGGGAGQKKQDPLHFSGNGAFLHLRRNSRGDVNSALQNAGSASPHGARSACASPCAYGGGGEGGVGGGGAGQKKQDPLHFSGNGAFLHLRRNSRGDVNSALQNAGSASPHGGAGAAGGDSVALLMLRNWTRRRVLRICMLARRTMTVVALCEQDHIGGVRVGVRAGSRGSDRRVDILRWKGCTFWWLARG